MSHAIKRFVVKGALVTLVIGAVVLLSGELADLFSEFLPVVVVAGAIVALLVVARGVGGYRRHRHALESFSSRQSVGLKRRVERV